MENSVEKAGDKKKGTQKNQKEKSFIKTVSLGWGEEEKERLFKKERKNLVSFVKNPGI